MNIKNFQISLFEKIYIFIFSIYLIFGNLIRFIHIRGFNDNILLTEFLLYLFGGLFFIFKFKISLKILSVLKYLYLFLFISFVYGVLLNDFELKAFLFFIRFTFMIFSAIALGYIFYKKYKDNEILFLKKFLNIFLISLIIGYIIFIIFRESASFWAFLALYGIDFHGDPHVGRFISVYFDPNFYSNIAVLYLLISFYLFYKTKKNKYMIYFAFIFISIILAGSRSGLATLLLVLFVVFLIHSFKTRIFKKKKFIYSSILIFILMLIVFPILIEKIDYILLRINLLLENIEESARYKNMIMGLNIIENYPIFGVGFGYVYKIIGNGANWLDSFLLNIIAMFGIVVGSIIYSSLFFISILNIYKKELFIKNIMILFVILLVFGSQFNPILTYQFFLIPFIIILSYYYFKNKVYLNEKISS